MWSHRESPALQRKAESARPDWMTFQGGMMISFLNAPLVIRHEIKAVK